MVRARDDRRLATRTRAVGSVAVGLLIAVAAEPVSAQVEVDVDRMREVVDSYVDNGTFMGSVLVARGDDALLSEGYGSANLEWDIPNTSTTKFRLGSITKQFTAAAILILAEQGKLSIDDPIETHVGDAPPAWDDITIRHVLNHTSGIPSFTGFPDYATLKLSPSPIEQTFARFRDEPLEFEPGTRYNYSNSGYLLLGYLVEQISGMGYEDFLLAHVFDPLGMDDTGLDSNAAILSERAAGYSPGPDGPMNAEFIHMSIPHGAGALYSTTEDLLRWTRGLFGGDVLAAESLEQMTAPVLQDYGFGVSIADVNGRRVVQHGGGIEGFNTFLAYYPDTEITIVALANLNGNSPQQLAGQLGLLAHGEAVTLPAERTAITLPDDVLSRFVGTYSVSPAATLTITLTDGRLFGQMGNGATLPFFAESEKRFFLRAVDAEVEFEQSGDAPATAVTVIQAGREQRAPRIDE